MTEKPLLTVVIPTHNRAQYAQFAITSVLSITSPILQLVVHDTSENDELQKFIAENVHDERLKYIRYPYRLSMTDNHNAAMQAAEGEYVCLIGDDDTIMPEAIDAVLWASANEIDVLSPLIVANYAWPDFRSRYFGMGHAGRLYIARKFRRTCVRDSRVSLRKALRNAAQGTDGLPKIYHGFVRRRVMDAVRDQSGAYFHGSSPDVSGAIGLALMVPTFVEVGYPLTLPGASAKSNTGRSAVNTHKGALSTDAQTADFVSEGWPNEVPRFFSVETVWAHAAVETIQRIDGSVLQDFDFMRLYAACWLRYREFRNETMQAFNEYRALMEGRARMPVLALIKEIAKVAAEALLRLARRVVVPTAAGGRNYIKELPTIAASQEALTHYLKNKQLYFGDFVLDFIK